LTSESEAHSGPYFKYLIKIKFEVEGVVERENLPHRSMMS